MRGCVPKYKSRELWKERQSGLPLLSCSSERGLCRQGWVVEEEEVEFMPLECSPRGWGPCNDQVAGSVHANCWVLCFSLHSAANKVGPCGSADTG